MKIKGAIFDLDGTLLDSMIVWDGIGELYLTSKGYTPAAGLREALRPMSLLQAAQYFRDEYHVPDSEEAIRVQIDAMIEDAYFHTILLKAGVKPFLDQLKSHGVKMCIATATDRHLVEAALERLGISPYFYGIITCYEVGAGKDQPHTYQQALALLGTDIDETVVFEDALHAVLTAKTAGFLVASVYDKSEADNQEKIKAAADWYLNNFTEWDFDE